MRRLLLAAGLAVGSSVSVWAAPPASASGGFARAIRQPVVLRRVFVPKPADPAIRKAPHTQAMPIPTTWDAVPVLIPTRWQVVVGPASERSGGLDRLRTVK